MGLALRVMLMYKMAVDLSCVFNLQGINCVSVNVAACVLSPAFKNVRILYLAGALAQREVHG